jgi:Zn-dependent peptidase ImmA (M78 family)/transcriptional regulator with XRE-family HTH domain
MDPIVLGARVRHARQAAELTQEQLSELLEIPRSAVSEIENGHRGLSAAELIAVSKHLRRGLDYFVGDGEEASQELNHFDVRFRSLQLRAGDADTVFRFEQRCRDYKWLEDILAVPSLNRPPVYPLDPPRSLSDAKDQGEELAAEERNRLALGSDPVQDPFNIVESQGVRVILMSLETPDVSGIFHHDEELGACFLVNTAFHRNRWSYDLLHEYCHVLVDRFSGSRRISPVEGNGDLVERRANAFAAAFLLPTKGVERFLATRGVKHDSAEYLDIFYVMAAFGASFQATVFRLRELGFLHEARAEAYLSARNVNEMIGRIRRAEGIKSVDFGSPAERRFGQLVLRAYKQDKISIGRAAELLDLDFLEARELAWLWKVDEKSDLQLSPG